MPSQNWRRIGVRTGPLLPYIVLESPYASPSSDCSQFQEIQIYLKSIDHPFQIYPPNVTPHSLHTFDPIGTLIGFVAKHHPFSSNIRAPPKTSSIAQSVCSPQMTSVTAAPPPDTLNLPNSSSKKKRIGVMTSGGDSPGMNAVVRAVARMALAKRCEPYAIHEGYEGLVQGGSLIQRISWEDVRGHLSEVCSSSISVLTK